MTTERFEPERLQPLDELDLLISLLDMLMTIAQPREAERVQDDTENTVSGIKTFISPVMDARPPYVMTYEQLIFAASAASDVITDKSR